MVSSGAGLPPAERVELLAFLVYDKDEAIAQRAADALLVCELEDFLTALKREEPAEELFKYCADHIAEKPGIADTMAENFACPAEQLLQVAPLLKEAVNALVEDLDRLSSTPGLVTALAPSTYLGPRQKAVIDELQKDELPDEMQVMRLLEGMVEAIPEKKERLSLYQRVSKMRVSERMQLAIRGGREERMLLIRDSSKLVQRAVLKSPRATDQEIEGFAGLTSLSEDVLRAIASSRKLMKSYTVLRNLTFNPKVPTDITIALIARLLPNDLKHLIGNKNVPELLRTTAQKLYRQRSAKQSSGE